MMHKMHSQTIWKRSSVPLDIDYHNILSWPFVAKSINFHSFCAQYFARFFLNRGIVHFAINFVSFTFLVWDSNQMQYSMIWFWLNSLKKKLCRNHYIKFKEHKILSDCIENYTNLFFYLRKNAFTLNAEKLTQFSTIFFVFVAFFDFDIGSVFSVDEWSLFENQSVFTTFLAISNPKSLITNNICVHYFAFKSNLLCFVFINSIQIKIFARWK